MPDTNNKRWSLPEQVAFECALAKDDEQNWNELKRRDEAMGLSAELLTSGSRRNIARQWLSARLGQDSTLKQAADSIAQTIRLTGQLLALGGFICGIGLATAALTYTGKAPINVSAFFSVFVLLQAISAFLTALPFLFPRLLKEKLSFGPLFRVARGLFNTVYKKIQTLVGRYIAGNKRHEAADIAAEAASRMTLHSGVMKWLVFRKVQTTALCFNLGALLALLAAVVFTDRAFGWQTTLNVSSDTIYTMVKGFATPWSWLYGEGVGFPDLAQIEGSRIRLKEGIQALDTDNLASWWRFLALGIVVYGILPRLFFSLLGKIQLAAALNRYDFRNAAAERLFSRLLPTHTRFQVESVKQGASEVPAQPAPDRSVATDSQQKVFTYCSRDLVAELDPALLQRKLAQRWNLPEDNVTIRVYDSAGMNANVGIHTSAQAFAIPEASESRDQFALVYESWMPPIKEIERQLRSLRSQIDSRNLIKVVLLGIPGDGDEAVVLRPTEHYAGIWDAFIRRQGDPYLILDNPA